MIPSWFSDPFVALEYVAGFLSERILGLRLWDYSKNRFNLQRGFQQLQAFSDGNPALESDAVDRAKAGSRSLVKNGPRGKLITNPWSYDVPKLSLVSLAAVTPREMEVGLVGVLRQRKAMRCSNFDHVGTGTDCLGGNLCLFITN